MTLKNFTTLTGIAVALLVAPAVDAQESARRGGGQAATVRSQPAISSGSRTQFEHRRGHRWGGHRHGDWRHRRYYPRHHVRYSPFYGHPFGYGYPYGYGLGYGYGYPYYGASAALYYHGYHPAPRERAYTPTDRVYTPRNAGSVVAQVQQELSRGGYYRSTVDGIMGNGTRNAIRAYQRANRLRVTGRIDQQLLRSMGIS